MKNNQKGFSLLEVLVAMLIAAVGIGAVMAVHASNLRQVKDNADLNRGQLILSNLVYRVQLVSDKNFKPVQTTIDGQGFRAGLAGFSSSVVLENDGYRAQIQWLAHDVNDVVVRDGCVDVKDGHHCLSTWVAL